MSKFVIEDSKEGTKTPFLRGILTISLLEAGMPFEEAYHLASSIRHQLFSKTTITTSEMRETVVREQINFEQIWELQSYLLSEADKSAMDIVTNDEKDQTTERGMRSINEVLKRDFSVTVEEIFGNQITSVP